MANRSNRPMFSRARQRSMDRKRLIIIGGAAAALVLVVTLALLLSRGNGPDRAVSKYELLQLFNHHMRGDAVQIQPVEGIVADKSLKRTRFEFAYRIPDYEIMVAELADWMRAHRDMYPHYHL